MAWQGGVPSLKQKHQNSDDLACELHLIAVFGALRHTERYGPLRWVYSVKGCVENLRWSNPEDDRECPGHRVAIQARVRLAWCGRPAAMSVPGALARIRTL